MNQPKEFNIVLLEPGQGVALPPRVIQLKPIEAYVFPHGSVDHEMSFAVVLSAGQDPVVVTQLSAKMLLENLSVDLLNMLSRGINAEFGRRGLH